jgi:NAD(P)H-hydrate epimerase
LIWWLRFNPMKIFSTAQVRDLDRFTIEHEPIASIDLMERAAGAIFRWFAGSISAGREILVLAGPGNNGGDGLALARMLTMAGYNAKAYYLTSGAFSDDFRTNLLRLNALGVTKGIEMAGPDDFPPIGEGAVVVDALYGSGLTRPLEGLAAQLVRHINSSAAFVVSIDIPSGLMGEANPYPNPNPVVKANRTLTLQTPKLSFFFAENEAYTGAWEVLPIGLHPEALETTPTPYRWTDTDLIRGLIRKRPRFSHKGTFGHCLIVAGSYGMMGASVLATRSCIRGGCGLVTSHIPRLGYSIMQHSVPEALADVDDNDWCFSGLQEPNRYSAICVGPGLGKACRSVAGLSELLRAVRVPLLLDADALNIMADNPELLGLIPKNTVLTPHPGEFDRLFGKSACGFHRLNLAIEKAGKHQFIIVLKGAFTQVVCPDGRVFFNSTGNPGMATGGSGDVLSGIITSLLGQGYEPLSASIIGVYIHGLAGDLAASTRGQQALIASDILDYLGEAFIFIENL